MESRLLLVFSAYQFAIRVKRWQRVVKDQGQSRTRPSGKQRREIASPGSCRKVVGKKPPQRRQWRLQVEVMELEAQLAQMKDKIRDWAESLSAVNTANPAEAQREQLVNIRNALKYNLLGMKATEASLMHQLGFL